MKSQWTRDSGFRAGFWLALALSALVAGCLGEPLEPHEGFHKQDGGSGGDSAGTPDSGGKDVSGPVDAGGACSKNDDCGVTAVFGCRRLG